MKNKRLKELSGGGTPKRDTKKSWEKTGMKTELPTHTSIEERGREGRERSGACHIVLGY